MQLQWHPSKDGFTGSKCDRWAIYPMRHGHVAIQEYKLLMDNRAVGLHRTRRAAKSAAQAMETARK